jgi:DNA-binding MurR/RpiR family transcriptional regulator
VTSNSQPTDHALTQIKSHYDTLSKRQKKVADFIIRQGIDAVYYSASQIATLTGVDRSTVTRLAQTLGYSGFPELQSALRGHLISQTRMTDRLVVSAQHLAQTLAQQAEEEGASSILAQIVRYEFEHVGELLLKIPDSEIQSAADMIEKARKVYILGLQYTAPLAMMMATLVGFARKDYVVLDSNAIHLSKQLEDLTAEDVVFGFAFNPVAHLVIRCLRYAKSVGTPIILLSDSSVSTAALLGDKVMVAPYHLWSTGYALAPFALMNAIFGTLILRGGDEAQERVNRLGKIDEFLDVFEPNPE